MGNKRIVVVEDEIFIRLDLMTHLGTAGHAIVGALGQTHWNRKRAARDLQISYKSLLYKIKQIGAALPVPGKGEEKA